MGGSVSKATSNKQYELSIPMEKQKQICTQSPKCRGKMSISLYRYDNSEKYDEFMHLSSQTPTAPLSSITASLFKRSPWALGLENTSDLRA